MLLAVLLSMALQTAEAIPAPPTITLENFQSVLNAHPDRAPTTNECRSSFSQSNNSNGLELFYGAIICSRAEMPRRAAVLLHLGQIRSLTDMAVELEVQSEPTEAMTILYGLLNYQFGGTAGMEIYRNQGSRTFLIRALRRASGLRDADYQPGWAPRFLIDPDHYAEVFQANRSAKLLQLLSYSQLVLDNLYFEAQLELSQLQSQNPGGFIEGTPASDRSLALQTIMQERAAAIEAIVDATDDTTGEASIDATSNQ